MKDVKFNVELKVNGKEKVVEASVNAQQLADNLGIAKTKSDVLRESLIKYNQITQSFQTVLSSLQGLASGMQVFTDAYNKSEQANVKLTTVMRERMDATDEDIASVKRVVAAQKELGVVGGLVQTAGAQQIATFVNQKESLERLIPAMNNLLVQKKGLSATEEDAVAIGNLLGKAMQGNANALTRVGVTLDENQKRVIKYGTEEQRAAMLAKVISANVGEMNAEMAKTSSGQAKQMANDFAVLKVRVGSVTQQMQPYVQELAQVGFAFTAFTSLATGIKGVKRAGRIHFEIESRKQVSVLSNETDGSERHHGRAAAKVVHDTAAGEGVRGDFL